MTTGKLLISLTINCWSVKSSLDIPCGVARWVADVLAHLQPARQAINGLSFRMGPVPAGVPEGTKLGPWLFLLKIYDLRVPNVQTWKYVDDITVAEIVQRNASGDAQVAVSVVEDWSNDQNMQLNGDKCKVMVIDLKQKKHVFSPLKVDGKEL